MIVWVGSGHLSHSSLKPDPGLCVALLPPVGFLIWSSRAPLGKIIIDTASSQAVDEIRES